VNDRSYLSIGEVLQLLHDEFPDVTISKIRFLESQGLIDPERTPSGYRKFYDPDIDRLKFILREQKDSYLPLKVIKTRLDSGETTGPVERPIALDDGVRQLDLSAGVESSETEADGAPAAAGPSAEVHPAAAPSEPAEPADPDKPDESNEERPPAERPKSAERGKAAERAKAGSSNATGGATERGSTANLTFEELAGACGLSPAQLREVERYGLIVGRPVGRTTYYDEEATAIARLAAGFLRFGIEPRHLRMYRNAAEREAGVFEQVILPLVKQRNPAARSQALGTLSELSQLGAGLRDAMVRQALRGYTESL
jgi:DNA-binding transcriptional MerR regulator